MAIAPTLLSWEPTLKLENHLYHYSPQFPPHASFPPRIKLRKNVMKLSFKCFDLEINHHSCLAEMKIKQINPVEIVARSIVKALKASAAGAVLVGFLLMYYPNYSALAASGGRMGGNSFSSRSSSSSSSSSRSYTSRSGMRTGSDFSFSAPYSKPSPYKELDNIEFFAARIVSFFVFFMIIRFLIELERIEATDETSVLKLQVGLLGLGRSLQQDLNRIAETADTSTPEGLHYVLTETVLALLRHPDYCISAYSSVDVERNMEDGEKRFNQLSVEERVKFDEETLVNVNNIKKKSSTSIRAGGCSNEYIVITILVAAEGGLELQAINNSNDFQEALQKLASIPSRRKRAVEVLWTPQNEGDALSERQLRQDYPFLRPL